MSSNGNSLVPALPGGPPPVPGMPRLSDSHPPIDPIAGGEGQTEATPLKKVHQLLRGRYHWAALLAAILGSIGAVGGYFMKKPVFESIGLIHINPSKIQIIGKTPETFIQDYEGYLSVQMKAMTGERLILRALDKPEVKQVNLQHSAQLANDVSDQLTVTREGKQMIRVGYEDHDPLVAYAIVKSIVASYMELYGDSERQQTDSLQRYLDERRMSLTSELTALRDRQFALVSGTGGLDINDEFQLRRKKVLDIQNQISQVEVELAKRGVNTNAIEAPKEMGDMTIEEMAEQDGVLAELLRIRSQLEAEKDVLVNNYGPQYRRVRDLQQRIDTTNNRIAERRKQLIDGAMVNTANQSMQLSPLAPFSLTFSTTPELQRLLQKLRGEEAATSAALMEISKTKNEMDRLREEIDTVGRRLMEVRGRIEQIKVDQGYGEDRVSVIADATSPTTPSNGGKRKQLAALGGMAGMSMGVFIVLLFGLADPRLRTIDDARSGLYQARMLGILPSLPEDLADPQQASIAAHCVHHIRTMMQVGVSPDEHRVYSVTSPGAGTGKTSLTLALGLSFAASESKTLLIDCDLVGGGLTRRVAAVVRRRIGHLLQKHGLVTPKQIEEALHMAQARQIRLGEALIELGYIRAADLDRVLNLQEQSLLGVMDACNGEQFDHCIAETGVKNLSILPTGTAMARHAASLSPGAVNRLVASARAKFDIVLIDTGPILGSLEASVVAGTVDGTVLIVSRGDHRAVCDKSVEYLQSIRANLMGIVFNRAEVHDFERSSFTSLASMTSLRPNDGEVVEGEVIDGEASARLGPVGSAVATSSRIARNGNGRHA